MAALMKVLTFPSSKTCTSSLLRSLSKADVIFENPYTSCLFSGACSSIYMEQIRRKSFVTHLTADKLWKGVTTVSNAGKKKGRGVGMGKKVSKDLNRGQIIGVGKVNMVWPGLNTPVVKGRQVVELQCLPPDPNREENLMNSRAQHGLKRVGLDPLDRGFTGVKWPGRSCGPPTSRKEGEFEGFDSKVLQLTSRSLMDGKFGRKRRVRALVVTGNKNGLAGFAQCDSKEGMSAINQAKNLAGKALRFIERYDGHTIVHNFHARYNVTELFAKMKPKGYGVSGHRVIKVICEMIGITDIDVRIEGSTNPLMITNAFFLGLKQQKTHQELADLLGLNVVEFKKETDLFPRLIAAPKTRCRTREEIPENEITNYDEVINEGRLEKPVWKGEGCKRDSRYLKGQKKILYQRNHLDVFYRLMAKHGVPKSFYHFQEEERLKKQKILEVTEETKQVSG